MLSPVHWLHYWEIIHENFADATIDPERGVVGTTIWDPEKYPLETNVPVAGDKSYHTFDYAFFYENVNYSAIELPSIDSSMLCSMLKSGQSLPTIPTSFLAEFEVTGILNFLGFDKHL